MRHTIELSEAGEAQLRRVAQSAGQDADAVLGVLANGLLVGELPESVRWMRVLAQEEGLLVVYEAAGDDEPPIRSTPNVMGGDACVRNTRIPVWMLVGYRQSGFSDERILANYPGLGETDLSAAWAFYAENAERVDGERRRQEEAD